MKFLHFESIWKRIHFVHRCSMSTFNSSDLQLVGSQIFFRHGARTPLVLLHGLNEVSYPPEHLSSDEIFKWNVELKTKLKNEFVSSDRISSANDILKDKIRFLKSINGEKVLTGQLTSIGEKQLFQLGKSMQKRLFFHNDQEKTLSIPKCYHPDFVFCRSTYMDRTIASARAFLVGFYTFDEQIRAEGPFQIEVQHFPDETMFPNRFIYPILNECPNAEKLYEIFDDQHHLKVFRNRILQRLGIESSPYGIGELSDDLISRQAHGFPIPEHLVEFLDEFDVNSAREFVEMTNRIDFDEFIRCTCGSLLTSIKNHFDSIFEKKTKQRFFVYSGHDTTLVPLALALGIFDMRWPRYGSHLLIQFYVSKTDENQRFLSVDFANEPKKLFGLDSDFCPYSTFVSKLEHQFV